MSPSKTRRRGSGEGGLYQRSSDGMWCASIELPIGEDGQRRRRVVCRRLKADARDELRKIQDQLAEQGDIIVSGAMTLEKWITYWLKEIAPKKIRPNTLSSYRSPIENHIIPAIGRHQLAKLTPEHIRHLHKTMAQTPADPKVRRLPKDERPEAAEMMSSTSILLAHNALSAALKTAVREGNKGIRVNPCDLVDRPRKRVVKRTALTVEESIQLLAFCATIPDGPLWASYLLTAARRGELIGLEPGRVTDHLDLSWQTQRVKDIANSPDDYEYRPVKGKLYLTRPKSESSWRMIPLVEPLRSTIGLAMKTGQGGFVFNEWRNDGTDEDPEWVNTGRPWDPTRADRRWNAVLKAAGLPDVDLHDLRHTTVDLLYAAEVPEQTIRDIVGHLTVDMTRKYRTTVDMDRLRAALTKMSTLLSPSAQGAERP